MNHRFQTPTFDAMMRRELARLGLRGEDLSVSSYKERLVAYAGVAITVRYVHHAETIERVNRLAGEGRVFSRYGPPYHDVRQWGMFYSRTRNEVVIELSESDDPAAVDRELDSANPFGKEGLYVLHQLVSHLLHHFLALSHVACAHPVRSAENPSEWVVPPCHASPRARRYSMLPTR
jgi:hypothetical protein